MGTTEFDKVEMPEDSSEKLIVDEQPIKLSENEEPSSESKDEGSEGKKSQTEGGDSDETEQPNDTDVVKYKIGDEEITLEEFEELKKGSLRQSDYTKKTQELAEIRKTIQPLIEAKNQMKSKEIPEDEIAEIFVDAGVNEEIAKAIAAGDFENVKLPDPTTEELEKLKEENQNLIAFQRLMEERDKLAEKDGIGLKVANEILEKAIEYHEKTGVAIPLEDMYKLIKYPELENKVKDEGIKTPVTANKTAGAKDIKTTKKITDIKDIPDDIFEKAFRGG